MRTTFSTEADIARLRAVDGKDTYYTDARTPGLRLRVSAATGRKTFLLEYRPPGSKVPTKRKLGLYTPEFNLKTARAEAMKGKVGLLSGKDPLPVEPTQTTVTVGFLIEKYKALRKPNAETIRILDSQIDPKFAARDATAIPKNVITEWHRGFSKLVKVTDAKGNVTEQSVPAPYAADRAIDVLKALFNFGIDEQYLTAGTVNPCAKFEKNFSQTENERHFDWTEVEIAKLAKTLSEYEAIARKGEETGLLTGINLRNEHGHFAGHYPSLPTVFALRFLILTGVRKNEALTLKWDQINTDRGVIVWTKYKAKKKRKIARPMVRQITKPLAELLKGIDEHRTKNDLNDNAYVFPGSKSGDHLHEIDGVWNGIRKECGFRRTLDDGTVQWARVHDLRHLYGDEAADAGLSEKQIAALMGHASTRMTARYSHVRATRNAENAELVAARYAEKLKVR